MRKPLPQDDLNFVVERTADVWSALHGARLFISGGTGFIGSWLLEVVRNTSFTFHRRERRNVTTVVFDEAAYTPRVNSPNAEEALVEADNRTILQDCIEGLPEAFREGARGHDRGAGSERSRPRDMEW